MASRTTSKTSAKRAEASDTTQLAQSMGDVVGRFVRAVREHSGTPSNAQDETLAVLERLGEASMAALAQHRGVTHQTMRLIVAKLVDRGFLRLVPDTQDRRAYVVHMTTSGLNHLAAGRAARTQWLAQRLRQHTDTQTRAQLKTAVQMLNTLIDGA